jgi:hypothetical protein
LGSLHKTSLVPLSSKSSTNPPLFNMLWSNFCPSTSGSTRWLCLKAQMLPVKGECECISRC